MLKGRAVAATVIAAVGLIVLAFVVRAGPTPIDAFDPAIRAAGRSGVTAGVAVALDVIGAMPIWLGLTVGVAAMLYRRSRSAGLDLLIISVLAETVTAMVKQAVDRPRPIGAEVTELLAAGSFPSGHVTRVIVLFGAVLALAPGARRHPWIALGAGLAGAVAMGLSRVIAGDHYVSDVLGAWLLGATVLGGWAVWRGREAGIKDGSPQHPAG